MPVQQQGMGWNNSAQEISLVRPPQECVHKPTMQSSKKLSARLFYQGSKSGPAFYETKPADSSFGAGGFFIRISLSIHHLDAVVMRIRGGGTRELSSIQYCTLLASARTFQFSASTKCSSGNVFLLIPIEKLSTPGRVGISSISFPMRQIHFELGPIFSNKNQTTITIPNIFLLIFCQKNQTD